MAQKHIDKEKRGKKRLAELLRSDYKEVCVSDPFLSPKAWAAKKILEINPFSMNSLARKRMLRAWPAGGRERRGKGGVGRWEWKEIQSLLRKEFVDEKNLKHFSVFSEFVGQYHKSFDLCVRNRAGRWLFVEMKVSEKGASGKDFLAGFFFGASANELEFARRFSSCQRFCFVRYPKKSSLDYRMVGFDELTDRLMRWHSAIEIKLGPRFIAKENKTIIPWANKTAWSVLLNRKVKSKSLK